MDNEIAVSAVVGLITASSLYVWNSNEFTKEQKTFLLIAMVFAPVQWIGILAIKYYNNHKFESTPERKTEKKLDSTISNLTDLKNKGIITENEYKTKIDKIQTAKTEQNLKSSVEYSQLKSLFDARVLTKSEFEEKIKKIEGQNDILKERIKKYLSKKDLHLIKRNYIKNNKYQSSTIRNKLEDVLKIKTGFSDNDLIEIVINELEKTN